MDEKVKESVLALLASAKENVKNGNVDAAVSDIENAEDEIKRPIGGGNNGRPGEA